jgi:hypothetical protein
MFQEGGFFAFPLSLDSRKRPISRESIMVLNGAMNQEELALVALATQMPVDGFETEAYGSDGSQLPVFIFGDDDDLDEDDDFEDEDDDYEDEDDDLDDDEEDEDDDYEDDDYEDEEEDLDDDEDEDDVDYDDFDES